MLADFRRLLLTTAWAPVSVLIFHAIIAETQLRRPFDFTMHFLGGASMAFAFFHALKSFAPWLGSPTSLGRFLHSFALACTVGLFWEFAELFSDVFRGTHIQVSVQNIMSDLMADTAGAIASLALIWLVSQRLRRD